MIVYVVYVTRKGTEEFVRVDKVFEEQLDAHRYCDEMTLTTSCRYNYHPKHVEPKQGEAE